LDILGVDSTAIRSGTGLRRGSYSERVMDYSEREGLNSTLAQELSMGDCVRFAQNASNSRRTGAPQRTTFRILLAPRPQLSAAKGSGSAGPALGSIGLRIDSDLCLEP